MKLFEDLPSTKTPINAENLNQIQDNLVVVSATEPTGDNREKVWIQRGKNLIDFKKMINSSLNESNGMLQTDVTRLATPFIFLLAGTYTVSCNLSRFAYVIYNKDKTFKSFVTWNTFPNQIVLENDCYIKLEVIKDYNGSENVSIADIEYLQLEQGSTATKYEEYIEPKIYVLNDYGVYEEFITKEDDLADYKPSLVKDDTYVSSIATNWCEVRNGIAYVSMNLTLVAGEMSTAAATLVSGLPTPKVNAEIQTHLYNSTENHSIRARITTAGLLRWWYNPTVTVKSSNALSVNITYPVANT